jgi:iron complex outermembrane receptor protein
MTARFFTTASIVGLAAAALMPGAAFAQDTDTAATAADDVIVVTAQRREERNVDVPISITAISAQQLTTANVQNLGDIQKITPSLRFDNQAGFFQPTVRGIGTAITTSGGGSNVGIYIDGFYSPNPVAANFQLTKISSIQVLKGPQGTLFGHNTTGGAILLSTADPSENTEVDMKASYGSFNTVRLQGYATTGIAPGVAVDIEGVYGRGDGFVTNIVDGNDHVGRYENWTVRAGLKVDLSDSVSVLARYQHVETDDPTGQMINSNTDTTIDPTTGMPWGVTTFTVPGTYTTDPDRIAANHHRYIRSNNDIAQLTIKADLGFANLTSYTQYRHEDLDQSEDLDQTALPIFNIGIPVVDTVWTQELLLTSKPGPRLQWTAGFYFFWNKDTWVTRVDPGSFGDTDPATQPFRLGGSGTTTVSYAGFLDATYEVTDNLFVTAGVRFSHDEVKDAYYNTSAFVGDPTEKNFVDPISSNTATPRVVVRYKPTDESSVYASWSRGYKAAIIDVGGSCQDGPAYICNPIQPEKIDAFEIGYKYDNRALSFSTSAFYYNYRNLQVSEFLGNAQAFIVNAAKSEIYGIDAELHYRLNDHFQINAGAAWTHARYKQFGGSTVTLPDGTQSIAGAPLYASCAGATAPGSVAGCATGGYAYVDTDSILYDVHMQHVPDFSANLGARYTTGMTNSGEFALSGNLFYTSSFFFSPSGTQFKQPGYATLALRGEWTDPSRRFTVAVFGDNVTNERYRTQVQYNSFGIGAGWSAPATWGIELGAKF